MIEQTVIALTTILAIYLSQTERAHLHRWACIAGIAGEPFWLHSSFETKSWGVFSTAVVVTLVWGVGIKNHWLQKTEISIQTGRKEK